MQSKISLLLLSTGSSSLGFGGTSDLLHSALDFLLLLSGDLALLDKLVSSQQRHLVELLPGIEAVVNESETGGPATSELGLEAEDGDLLSLGLEQRSKLVLDGGLLDVGLVGVDQLNHQLLSAQKWVLDQFLRIQDELFS